MKITTTTIQEVPSVDIHNCDNGALFVVTEDCTCTASVFDVPKGTVLLNVYGAFVAFLEGNELRYWDKNTVETNRNAVVNHLKVRKARSGEGVTISA